MIENDCRPCPRCGIERRMHLVYNCGLCFDWNGDEKSFLSIADGLLYWIVSTTQTGYCLFYRGRHYADRIHLPLLPYTITTEQLAKYLILL